MTISPRRTSIAAASCLLAVVAALLSPSVALAQNPIVTENALTGNPASEWDVSGAGDPDIQGFATDISVNKGGTVHFKISSSTGFGIKIYRLGYYQGNGAREVADLGSSFAGLVQAVPAMDPVTGLVDCGGWAESASWAVPTAAVSGIYIAKLTRSGGGSSHIAFIVRDDASTSDLLFKTSDATWQAYNGFGGNSLYVGSVPGFPAGHATKVSYNRPFTTRGGGGGGGAEDWVFNAEYPMVRFLERNGYDVSYTTDIDADRYGSLIANHNVFLSVGHDEYWSAGERANVTAARDAGTHLAFFSGNEIYWKTRWEPSADGTSTPYRTLVCYKEGTLGENQCGTKCDPLPNVWTGLWRDGCAPTYAPNDACLPENSLSGQISWDGSTGAIQVPDTYKSLRFWRNTSVATLGTGQTATLGSSTLGYEWDWQQYDAFYPARRILLSTTSLSGKTHHLSLYRHTSGALVFGAGTVQWSWGLDGSHDRGSDPPVIDMQQATVNLFADMGVDAGSLQPGLVSATASSDTQAPASVIGFPLDGGSVASGTPVTIEGTATDVGGGVVAGVEVSVDGGATWSAAVGTTNWTYSWIPGAQGSVTIKSRAFDDTGNLEVPTGPANLITVTVTPPVPPSCPCTVFQPTDTPAGQFNDGRPVNVGMKFRTTVDGFITGARFYKGPANTGTHMGLLWSSTGVLLAQEVFTGETASGWQEVTFTSPVAVTAGTTYIVAYHSSGGGYAATNTTFTSAVVNGPLRGLAWGEDGPNGVYAYAATPTFPTQNYLQSNYWADVVFNTTLVPDETPPIVTALSPTNGATAVGFGASVSATFNEPIDATTVSGSTFELRDGASALVPATVSYTAATRTATLVPGSALTPSTTYTATLKGGGADPRIKDLAGNALAANQVWSFTTDVPDVTPPVVTTLSPTNGASAVAVNTSVRATFNEAIDATTVSGATFELRDGASALVPATVSYNAGTRTATLAPTSTLAYSTAYTATVKGGGTDPRIKDVAGNALAANQVWSFTTSSPPPPPPTEGPGGPILVISAASNPFSRYYVEILRAEGLNEFFAMDISQVTAPDLANYDVVILGEMPLTAPQVTMLTDWTNAGGTLVTMRPDAQLAGLLGITAAGGALADKYLLVNTASGPGVGIVNQTIQYHGTADLYTLSGASSLATLYSNATTATTNPAVTTRNVGSNGGKAIAFTYDLARSVVYTRQGNPAWSAQKRDGQIEPIRSDDLFYGNASFDPQPDWVDLNKVAIPQADEQQRLLANAITLGNLHRKPLPRLWYLPKGLKAAIVMTGDDHGDAGMRPRFDKYMQQSTAGCSPDDWECIRATGYLYVGGGFPDTAAARYESYGFETALHINTGCARATQAQFESFTTTQLATFVSTYPSIGSPVTNRNHCIAWSDWSSVAEVSAAHGIRLDTNYYYWPPSWVQNRSGMFTGSGIPMRFAKLDGTIIDCFQASTEMPDESGESFPAFCDQLLDRANGPEGYYGVFTTNMHFDSAPHAGSDAIVASAQARGVPVVSAKQMLAWLDGRNGSSFANLVWSGNTLSFGIAAAVGSRNMRAMVPLMSAVGPLSEIRLNGSPVTYTTQTIKGIAYAFFPANAGNYVADYSPDTTPPVITTVVAVPHDDGTATITWTTNEASDSRVDYGTAQGSLTLNAGDAAQVTSHTVTLAGLAATTTYYYRVTSTDAASNSVTEPIVTNDPLSFLTPAGVCFRDQTTSEFAAGTTGTGTSVVTIADGEVTLRAAAAAEFTVLPPPSEWQSFAFATGGTSTVAGGLLTVDGARFNTEPTTTTYSPGTSVEFVATFNANQHQYVGFGAGDDGIGGGGMFNTAPWAMFGTGTAGTSVLARVNLAGTLLDFTVPGSLLGTAHKYRVVWKTTSVDFYVDDALVHTETATVPGPMRVAISDYAVGGLAVVVDWIHVTPYAASGSFTSRVFDGGSGTTWGQMTWTASLPAGTSLQMFERQGSTPAPDGSWTAYTTIPSSGTTIGGSARYIQYRADLATTVSSATPVLQGVHVTCNTGPDTSPPVISGVTATPAGGGGTAVIGWNTDELATSRVDYGTAQGSLTLNASNASLVGVHALTLTGLTPNTPYYYRVTSVDAASNSATEPILANPPLTFTTLSAPCIVERTAAEFAAGTPGAATYVSETSDGEIILKPTEGAEFSGASLPAGWSATAYAGGGTAVVSGGHVSVDGAYVAPATSYTAGRSVEFVATFDATAVGQHAGFGTDLNTPPWAIFSTHGGGVLEARTNPGSETNTLIPGSWLGAPHRFRIDWNTTSVVYSIDGAVVAIDALTISAPMRPIVSDGPVGGNPTQVDWMRMTAYPAAGSYTSRVFDSGGATTWGAATWTRDLPAGTGLAMLARVGNTATPDGSWTAFTAIPSSGSSIGASGRYLQYRADLSTSDASVTPALSDLSVVCTTTTDVTPPVITNIVATSAGNGLSASVTWTTDEQATSRVDYGTSSGSLTLNVSSGSLATSHSLTLPGLASGTTYYYRVTSVDPFANSATSPVSPATLNFTTTSPPCAVDVTASDFSGGTTAGGTYISDNAGGEVILQPAAGAEFSGTTLPSGWSSGTWAAGGTANVGGGLVTVDGAHVNTTAGFGPGRFIEFIATFQAANYQNVGLAADGLFAAPWVTIGEGGSTGGVYARRDDGADVLLSATALGSPHRYRIDWNAGNFVFYVDGVQTATMTKTVATNMVAIISDFNVGGPAVSVDWLRMTPYGASGSYTSRVFDSGGTTTWGAANWTSDLPAGTSIAMSARRGSTPVPDVSWTSFISIPSSGSSIAGTGRYLQYKAELATTDGVVTPQLLDVSIQCVSTPDATPPVITNVVATPAGDGLSAVVTWTTDEPANSRVDYGTSSGSLPLNATNASFVTSHSLTLTGLSTATTYYFRVTSADPNANSATQPIAPATANFTTPAPCPSDATASDFGLGTLDANTVVSLINDGEVILKPTSGTEFSGTTLPADWQSAAWAGGTTPTVGGGLLTLSGGHAATTGAFGPGRSIEFVATFRAEANQHVGFTADFAFNSPWAIFSTFSSTTGLYARVSGAGDILLSSSLLGSPHRFRIDWNATNFAFYVDGGLATTITSTVTSNMLVHASDLPAGPLTLSVDWLRVTPYAASGSFTSRIFDQGGPTNWGVAAWTSNVPSGTSLSILARAGNTATPDGTWSSYQTLTNGTSVGVNSRYLQYRADLSTSALGWTPEFQGLAIACVPGLDVTPPVITNVAAAPALDGLSAVVTWTTDEFANSRVDYGTTSGALMSNESNASLVKAHSLTLTGLSPLVTYYYRVTSVDGSTNSATSTELSFTTPAPACFVDQTESNFLAGTTGANIYVSNTTDGEVISAPTLGNEFTATSLPTGWTSVLWSSGSAGGSTFPGGSVTVDGGRLTPTSTTGYSAGRVLEFVGTFAAAANQHIGFGSGDNATGSTGMFNNSGYSWAMFSTAGGTTALFARIASAGAVVGSDLNLGASYLGAPHLYRIEWKASPDSVIFLIDGASVRRAPVAITATMRPGASDYTAGGAALSINWLRMSPYLSPGSFTSRVYDGGAQTSWGAMTWTSTTPTGTSLALSVRKGNTPTPDGTWTAFAAVPSSGSAVGGVSRYIQYRADFTTSEPGQTAALKDVSVTCVPCNVASTPIANLTASATGNAGDGRANVRLNWSGVTAGDVVSVYRKAYGDYPLYRSDHGAVPAAPATPAAAVSANWTLTGVSTAGGLDVPPTRGLWYYAAFVTNACGTVSAPSNVTAGTLDYLLGDVSNGTTVCASGGEAGDGIVNTADMSALGGNYGQSFGPSDSRICLDVGPTVDYGIRSRPTPDGVLNFEDLVVYALNYEVPLPAAPLARASRPLAGAVGSPAAVARPLAMDRDDLTLTAPSQVRAGETFEVVLRFGGTGAVHALSSKLGWDASIAEFMTVASGGMLASAGGVVFSPQPGVVDAAVLGQAAPGLAGEGDVAVVRFRALREGDPQLRLAATQARDGGNRPVTLGAPAEAPAPVAQATRMGAVFPNPFSGSLTVSFSLAREERARIRVYDVAGRTVRHLSDGIRPSGFHTVTWDGRDDDGRTVPSGFYVVRLEAGQIVQTRRVQSIR